MRQQFADQIEQSDSDSLDAIEVFDSLDSATCFVQLGPQGMVLLAKRGNFMSESRGPVHHVVEQPSAALRDRNVTVQRASDQPQPLRYTVGPFRYPPPCRSTQIALEAQNGVVQLISLDPYLRKDLGISLLDVAHGSNLSTLKRRFRRPASLPTRCFETTSGQSRRFTPVGRSTRGFLDRESATLLVKRRSLCPCERLCCIQYALAMLNEPDPAFDMAARIGTGWRWLDQRGSVSVRDGRVVLRKRKGDVIAEAPVRDVLASNNKGSMGVGTKVSVGSKTYVVEPVGFRISPGLPGHDLAESMRVLGNLKKGRELTAHFLTALATAGAQVSTAGNDGTQDTTEPT